LNTEEPGGRDDRLAEAIAIGSLAFVETVRNGFGVKARHRDVIEADGTAPGGAGSKFEDNCHSFKSFKTFNHCIPFKTSKK
jgi:hypothetical protein